MTIVFKAWSRALVSDLMSRLAFHYEQCFPNQQSYLCLKSGEKLDGLICDLKRAGYNVNNIPVSTDPKFIKSRYEKAIIEKKNLIIVSTYESACKIREAEIHTAIEINDEAHHLCEDQYLKDENKYFNVGGGVKLSMTATPEVCKKDTDIGGSLNTTSFQPNYDSMKNERFGKWTVRRSREMIEKGIICPPRISFMQREELDDDNKQEAYASAIVAGFREHKEFLQKTSYRPDTIGAKLLITVPSCDDVRDLRDCKTIRDLINQNITIITIDSKNGAFIDGIIFPPDQAKDAVLERLKAAKQTEEIIVIQIYMLGEGINVPAFTGCLPITGLGERNFVQFLGRTLRTLPEDIKSLYDKQIPVKISVYNTPNDHKRTKPYGHLIIPIFGQNDAISTRLKEIAKDFRENFNYIPYEVKTLIDRGRGEPGDDPLAIEFKEQTWKFWREGEITNIDRAAAIELVKTCNDVPANKELLNELQKLFYKVFDNNRPMRIDEVLVGINDGYLKETYNEMINDLKKQKNGVFSEEIKNKFGTIYTPDFVVEKTCELAFKYIPDGTDLLSLTYCDPACGDSNFAIYLYKRLMKVENGMTPIQKSEHILTKCLYGIEILKPMWLSSKLRLLNEHLKLGGDIGIFDKLNIYWGNTICVEKDTEQEWYKNRKDYEGGILPEEIRNIKWNTMVGNPPYSHLRNMDNRRYSAYPKQRDMAQVFIRWGLDHITEKGVVSYNTIDTWLNVKLSDGAKETRSLLDSRIREIVQDTAIMRYSEGGEGDVRTFILSFSNKQTRNMVINETNHSYTNEELLSPGFMKQFVKTEYPFKNTSVLQYAPKLNGGRSKNKFGTNTAFWKSFIHQEFDKDGEYYLIVKCRICCHNTSKNGMVGNYKLIKTKDFDKLLDEKFEGEVKNCKVSYEHGLWLIGYLNTKLAFQYIDTYTNKIGNNDVATNNELSNNMWSHLQVPDFNHYKSTYLKRHSEYLTWVEGNMKDKEKFLQGVDEAFSKLMGEETNVG